jgi:hypothetical protein
MVDRQKYREAPVAALTVAADTVTHHGNIYEPWG